jgi:multiple sugar transport system substrate-binding protein
MQVNDTKGRRPGRVGGRLAAMGSGVLALVALLVLVAGCGGGSGSSGGESLTIGMTSDLFPALKKPIEEYGKKQGLDISIREMPSNSDTYQSQIKTMFQAGSGEVDMFLGSTDWPAEFANNGWLSAPGGQFSKAEQEEFLPAANEASEWEGKIYGIPLFWDSGLLYYRKDLLQKAGFDAPPETWEELQMMAKKVMAENPEVEDGFTFTGGRYIGGQILGEEFIRTSGGNVLEEGEPVVDQAAAVSGLETERSMVTDGVSPEAVANWEEGEAEAPFLAGKDVFLRNWSYVLEDLRNPELSEVSLDQVGIAPIPRASKSDPALNLGGGWSFYVNGYSGNQEAAWALARYLTSQETQKHMVETIGYLPTRPALYEDSALVKKHPNLGLAKTAVEQAVVAEGSPYRADMVELQAEQFNDSLRGTSSPKEAAEATQSGLESVISRGE